MTGGRTLFDKLWDDHVILTREDGESLLWVDRHFVHEGSHHAFRKLDERGSRVAEPGHDPRLSLADGHHGARLAVDAPSAVVSITQGTNYDLVVINAATR